MSSRQLTQSHPLRLGAIFAACVAAVLLAGCGPSAGPGNPKVPAGAKSSGGLHAVIETDKGAIEIELLPKDAPKAVENFRLLAEHSRAAGRTLPDSPVEKDAAPRIVPCASLGRRRPHPALSPVPPSTKKHLFFCVTSGFVQTRGSLNGNATWCSPRSMSACHACVMDPAYPHPARTMTNASCRNCRFRVRNTACFYPLPALRGTDLPSGSAALNAVAGRCENLSTRRFIQV